VPSDIKYLTPADRDYSIRTMLGEAADQPDNGIGAVAHVIMNRARDGGFGGTSPADVVLAPDQFEPWSTRRRELLGYSPDSPDYKRAGKIFDDVVSGKMPDPTGGATHFLNADIVRQRRGGSLPNWAQGEGTRIGGHTFYGGKTQTAAATPENGQDPLAEFANGPEVHAVLGSTKPAAFVPARPATAARDVLDEFANPEPVATGRPQVPISGLDPSTPEYAALQARPSAIPAGGGIRKDIGEIGRGIVETPEAIIRKTGENFSGGKALMESGVQDLRSGNVLPSFPSSDPRSWEAGGALKVPGGGMAAFFSPVTAATNRLIGEPVTELTGNPSAGDRAEMLAGGYAVNKLLGGVVKALPANRAVTDVAETIGPERMGEVARRLRENPRLSPMDVDPDLRLRAQGLALQTEGTARQTLVQAAERRAAGRQDALKGAADELLGPTPDVEALKSGLRQQARTKGRELFGDDFKPGTVFADAKPVDVTAAIDLIDKRLKPTVGGAESGLPKGPIADRLAEIRAQLTDDKELLTDPKRLHVIQSDLGKEINDLSKSTSGTEKRLIGPLSDVQNKIVDAIDAATGGKYKPARAAWKDEMQVQEAFDKGRDIFRNRPSVDEDLPEYWRKYAKDASPEEMDAVRKGARVALDYQVRSIRASSARGTNTPEIPFNREKVEAILGKKEADKWARTVRDEADIANTNQKLFGNSETKARDVGYAAVQPREVRPASFSQYLPPILAEGAGMAAGFPEFGHVGAAALSAHAVASRMIQGIGRRADIARNNRLAEILSATGDQVPINRLLDVIAPKAIREGNKLFRASSSSHE
jgi:Cell Wall Hydrolase